MFFRSNTAHYRRQAQFEIKHNGANHLQPLSNGFLLNIEPCRDDHTTILRLFDPTSSTKIAERVITSYQARVLSWDKDSFLLQTDKNNKKLSILSSLNLETLSHYGGSYPDFYTNCLFDNGRLLSIWKQTTDVNTQVYIMSHDNKTNQFHLANLPIVIDGNNGLPGFSPSSYGDLIKLDNGQIVFSPLDRGSMVFVCEKKQNCEHAFSLSHVIHPKTSYSLGFFSSGNMVALTQGRLLTYQGSGEHFQVWDGKDCVKEWSWSEENIQCSDKKFRNWTEKVVALPDGDHLLVKMGYKIFVFNMETRQLQKVEIGKLNVWDFCVYPNGQAVILGMDQRCTMTTLLCIDFACIADYRKNITTLLSETIGKDVSSIVNGYLDLDGAWSNDEVPSNRGRCAIS